METTTKKDKAERDTICGLTHLNRSQFLIPCYQDLKKSDLHTYTGTSKPQPEQNHLCLVEYKHGITDCPGAGNSKENVIGRWEQKKPPGINRNEEERRAGEHQDKNINLVRCLARIIYIIDILD